MEESKYNNTTSILNISKKGLSCFQVLKILKDNGVVSNVTSNQSIQCDSEKCWLEGGCKITVAGLEPKYLKSQVWKPLVKKTGVRCGHLEIKGIYTGCILNFLRKSACNNKDTSI